MKKQWYKSTLFLTALIILIFSILTGVFTAGSMDAKSISELKLYINTALGDSATGFTQMLYTALRQNLVFMLLALIGSCNIWMFLCFSIIYIFKGFSVGFALGFTLNNFSFGLSTGVIISTLFNILLLHPIYLIAFCLSFKYAVKSKEQSHISFACKAKGFFKKAFIYGAIYIVEIIMCCPVAGISLLVFKFI